MLNITLNLNEQTIVHANPQDAGNSPAVPYANSIEYHQDVAGIVALTAINGSADCRVVPIKAGNVTVNIVGLAANGGPTISTPFTVTVNAGPLDHFAPTADPPTPIS